MEPYPYRMSTPPQVETSPQPRAFPWILLLGVLLQFLLARVAIIGEIYPLGIAFYAAWLWAGQGPGWPLWLALVGGTATSAPALVWDTALLAIALGFLRINAALFRNPWAAMAWITGMHWLVRGLLWLVMGGERSGVLAAIIFEGLLAGGCALGLAKVIPSSGRAPGWPVLKNDELVWFLLAVLGAVGGLQGLGIGGLSLQNIGQAAVVMLAAAAGGIGAGAVMGLAGGLLPVLTAGQILPQSVLYGLSGMLAGLFSGLKKPGIILGFLLGHLLLSSSFDSRSDLLYFLENSLAAAALVLLFPAAWLEAFPLALPLPGTLAAYHRQQAELFQERAKVSLGRLAAVFQELHQAFDRAAASQPGGGTPRLAQEEILQACTACPAYRSCWEGAPSAAYHDLGRLLIQARQQGQARETDIGPELRHRCLRPRELIAAAERLAREYHYRQFWASQVEAARRLVAEQMAGVAEIMRDLGEQWNLPATGPATRAAELTGRLQGLGLPVTGLELVAVGNNTWQVNLRRRRCEDTTECRRLMAPALKEFLDHPVTVDDHLCPWKIGGRECRITFWPTAPLEVTSGVVQIARSGTSFCGDYVVAERLEPYRYLAALSDGMGMGYQACRESETTVNMLRSLLKAGFSRQVAINTINCVLQLRSPEETYATLDLVLLDLASGRAEITKIGAAPSFLGADGQVEVLEAAVPPVGILERLEVEVFDRQMAPGDVLVMVSDGLLGAGPGQAPNHTWLVEALRDMGSRLDPQGMAELFLRQAQAMYGPTLRDDMSALVLRVEKTSE